MQQLQELCQTFICLSSRGCGLSVDDAVQVSRLSREIERLNKGRNELQAVSSGLQAVSGKTPRDPVAGATVADAVRIVDSYIKVNHEPFLHTSVITYCIQCQVA